MKEKIIGSIAGFLYLLYSITFRFKTKATDESAQKALDFIRAGQVIKDENYIYAVWHEDEMSMIPFFRGTGTVIMVSDSKDGAVFANALHVLGYETVRGSSSKGGIKAFIGAMKKVRDGYSMAIAVDGPRGPRHKVKEGVIKLSQKTNRPIVPLKALAHSAYCFEKSWSQSKLPLPISKITILAGEPKMYDADELEAAIHALS